LSTRFINLPAVNKRITLGAYVKAIRLAQANPTQIFPHSITTWWPTTGSEIMQQFRAGMMDRINQAIPYNRRGMDAPRP